MAMEIMEMNWKQIKRKLFGGEDPKKVLGMRDKFTEVEIEELLIHPGWNTFPEFFREWVEIEVNNRFNDLLVIVE